MVLSCAEFGAWISPTVSRVFSFLPFCTGGGRLLPFLSADLYPVLLQGRQEGQHVGHDGVNSDASPAVIQTWQ